MLVLFFDNFNAKWQDVVDNWSKDVETSEGKVVMSNEIIDVKPHCPFMLGVNIWNLQKRDKIYCFNANGAEYLEKCPCGQKYSVGFNYKDFERVEIEQITRS